MKSLCTDAGLADTSDATGLKIYIVRKLPTFRCRVGVASKRTVEGGRSASVESPYDTRFIARYLPVACQQAADRLRSLVVDQAPASVIASARAELAYVRHSKGPVYQSLLLTNLGIRQIDAVITKEQTPLERVRELGAALGVQIRQQQLA